jgi:glycosyltransferase involved in cell wall biosynthesis
MSLRVLRLYHSGVVPEYRQRERVLRERHGHDVHLICPPAWNEGGSLVRADVDQDPNVHVVEVQGRQHPILFWYSPRELRRVLRELKPDIVDLQEEPYSLAVASALRATRAEAPHAKVCIYSAQNIFKRYPPPFRQLERRALACATGAYPCSAEAGEVMCAKGYGGLLRVLPLGVTLPAQAPPEKEPLTIGFVGRIEPYKGGMIALEAFAKAAADIDAYLEFLGSGSQEDDLKRQAAALGVQDKVLFSGARPQDEALQRIARYAAVVMPSVTTKTWKEQFGRVAVQAMAACTPVIASDSGSLREVVGPAGILVPEGDGEAVCRAIRRILLEPSVRAELARLGRARAEERFTWERVADGCDELYRAMRS